MRWPILDVQTLACTPWMRFRQDTVLMPSGKAENFAYLERQSFVVVVAFTSDDQLVCVENYRPAVQRAILQLPMGLIELTDGSAAVAARRELAEETGYQAQFIDVLDKLDIAPGSSSQSGYICVARGLTPGEQKLDETEQGTEVRLFPYSFIKTLITEGKLADGPSLAALMIFEAHQ